jgi:MFS family permease
MQSMNVSDTQLVEQQKAQLGLLSWVVCFSAALFFFYEFIQMNMLNAISAQIMAAFHLNATGLGDLSAYYFYANLLFLLPAGIILDRFSTRKVILISLFICVLGTFLLAFATHLYTAKLARFLSGIGSAFVFLSCIRLASRWFPSYRMALVSGLIVTMAMLGGMVAQSPMSYLADVVGWRDAVIIDATFGAFIFAIIWYVVKDYPPGQEYLQRQENQQLRTLGFWRSMSHSYLNIQNWACGIYTGLMNLPIALLGALWGKLYLTEIYHFSANDSAFIVSMIFFGTIIGSPLAGWVSDRLQQRRLPMFLGSIIALLLVYVMVYWPSHSVYGLALCFFLLGLITSTQVISYPTVAENNSASLTATSVSVVSFSTISGYAIFQPFFGWIMDLNWQGLTQHGQPIYSAASFHLALLTLPISFILAFILVFFIDETYCKKQK